jgi:hypothetical protein
MKSKAIAHALLWAALLIAAALLLRHSEHVWTMFTLLLTGAMTSLGILGARECPERKTSREDARGRRD